MFPPHEALFTASEMKKKYDNIRLKRVYDNAENADGVRLLADRLWPRGIKKTALDYDDWLKTLCPSTELRKDWHQANLSRQEFENQYLQELAQQKTVLEEIAAIALDNTITLLSAAKDLNNSHLPVLKKALLISMEELDANHDQARSSPVCYQHD